jgi:hypothetical protein
MLRARSRAPSSPGCGRLNNQTKQLPDAPRSHGGVTLYMTNGTPGRNLNGRDYRAAARAILAAMELFMPRGVGLDPWALA